MTHLYIGYFLSSAVFAPFVITEPRSPNASKIPFFHRFTDECLSFMFYKLCSLCNVALTPCLFICGANDVLICK